LPQKNFSKYYSEAVHHGDGGCSFLAAYSYTDGPMAQTGPLGAKIGGHMALLCNHRVNRVHCRNGCAMNDSIIKLKILRLLSLFLYCA